MGTNNLPTDTAKTCSTKIGKLANKIKVKFPKSKVGISALITRKDYDFHKKLNQTNEDLRTFCKSQECYFIDNANTVLCKSFRPPSFCLSHKSRYLTQNRTNFNKNLTCGRAKRYLSLVTFKKLMMQTGSSAITGSASYSLSSNSKINHAN